MASQVPPVYSTGGAGHVNQISPQPQTVMMSAVPQQPIATSNRRADGSRISFAHHSARYCGIIQIVCGFILLIIGISMIPSHAMFYFIGYGFWGSILCFIAGGLGLHGSKTKNNCPIIGTMVMSIFTCLFGFVLFGFSAAGIPLDEHQRRCLRMNMNMEFDYSYRCYGPAKPADSIDQVNFRVACHSINLLVGIVLMVVPIVQSCVSCQAICCPTTDACFPQQTTTLVYGMHPQQQPIVYVMQQQRGAYTTQPGQIVYGQPLQVYGQPTANQPPGYGQPAANQPLGYGQPAANQPPGYGQPAANQLPGDGLPAANQPLGYGQPAVTTQLPYSQPSAVQPSYGQPTVAPAPPTGASDVMPGIHGLPSYNEAVTGVKSN
ncbi:uncharacterized protein LOC141912616 [Tubulanus polymorphus]|uniref:uncharacterized protein LOC141912616 n=1 Tax=Tubulanus polymorphus TaxID=672921 RepID=UPI003DA3357E